MYGDINVDLFRDKFSINFSNTNDEYCKLGLVSSNQALDSLVNIFDSIGMDSFEKFNFNVLMNKRQLGDLLKMDVGIFALENYSEFLVRRNENATIFNQIQSGLCDAVTSNTVCLVT